MKLLLTSASLTHDGIAVALQEMTRKEPAEVRIGFVTTAASAEPGNKDWLFRQLSKIRGYGYQNIDIVDPSVKDIDWRSCLNKTDVVVMSGGNTFHLLDQARKTGFDKWLQENLMDKIYVGISAGSIIMTPSIAIAPIDNGDENLCGIQDLTGLGFVDFEVSPHTPEDVTHAANEEYAKTTQNRLYAYGNQTAIKVMGNDIEIVGSRNYKIYE